MSATLDSGCMPVKHIASYSFGKDSLATVLLANKHGEPLDEVVYCEVMFDKGISGEVPEHRDFIYNKAIPALNRMGVEVVVLRAYQTYVGLFTGKITRGPKKGMVRSFPICGRCAVQRDCKARPIHRYLKTLPAHVVQYVGIAKDKTDRLFRMEGRKQVSLLEKYSISESKARQLCEAANVIKLRKRVLDAMYEESKTLFANIFVNLSKKVLTNQEKCAAVFANSENGPCN